MDWYICSYCKKTFPSKQQCSAHKNKEHRCQISNKKTQQLSKYLNKQPETNLEFQPNPKFISNEIIIDTRQEIKTKHHLLQGQLDDDCVVIYENGQSLDLNPNLENPHVSNFLSQIELCQKLQDVESTTKTSDCEVDFFVESQEISVQAENSCDEDFTVVSWSQSENCLKLKESCDKNPLGKCVDVTWSTSTLNVVQGQPEKPRAEPADGETQQRLNHSSQNIHKNKKKRRNQDQIYQHITVLNGPPRLYKCGVCLKTFKTKAHIHYHEFCQTGEKPFKCNTCGQRFIAKSHFEYHERTHTGERPFKCPYENCGRGFNQRGKVTRHLKTHTGERPFGCQQCPKRFANSQALRTHLLTHTGERPFPCKFCGKRFTGMTNVKKHEIIHTGERPFSCPICKKSFGLKWTLELHVKTHSSERPFVCDTGECSRAFSNSKDLRRHQLIHLALRPFKCWFCGTAFRRKDNLDRHIKQLHLCRLGIQKETTCKQSHSTGFSNETVE